MNNPNLLYPSPYITAFVSGGFGILLIGVLSPMVRKGIKRADSIAVLVILVGMAGWCGYSAMPHYGYYYQVAIQSSENLSNLELYLPMVTVSVESYEGLYNQVYSVPENFTHEIVDTEQGKMLKITIPELKKEDVSEPVYTANIVFRQESAPNELIRLMPRYDVEQVNIVISQQWMGPIKSSERLVVERFNIPVKIIASSQAPIKLTLSNRTDRSEAVNFTYSRSYPYTEQVKYDDVWSLSYDLTTGDEWIFVPVEATSEMEISGISD
jgi:hypothetical protein